MTWNEAIQQLNQDAKVVHEHPPCEILSSTPKPMSRLELMVHEMSGTHAIIVSQVLLEMVVVFKDQPDAAKRMADIAQKVFNAGKGVEALAAEIKRLGGAKE